MSRVHFLKMAVLGSLLLISVAALAQIDPSSGLLLGPGASQDVPSSDGNVDSGVESGRYTTRPKSTASRRKASTVTSSVTPALTPAPTVTQIIVETKSSAGPSAVSAGTQAPVVSIDDQVPVATPSLTSKAAPSVLVDVPDLPTPTAPVAVPGRVVEPVASPIPVPDLKPAPPAVYVTKPDPIDRRWDLLDVNVAPTYLIQDAKSRYTYRNDQLVAPGLILQADAWLVPSLGFHASFFSTLSGSLQDSLDGSQNVWAVQQNLAIGARWRHATSEASQAPTLVFGADWESDQLKVPSESMLRQHLETSGLTLSGGVEIPTTTNYAWTAELSLMPLASQVERSSAVAISSGSHADSNAVGLSIGGRYAFDHADSVYWKITGRFQKDVYDGQASPPDPITGQTLSGVTITTKSLLLELGFSFGD